MILSLFPFTYNLQPVYPYQILFPLTEGSLVQQRKQ